MKNLMRLIAGIFLVGMLLSIIAPLVDAASASTRFQSPGTRVLDRALQAVPSSPTALTTTDTEIYQISIGNTTAGACTFTLADRATSAKTIMGSVSIAANTTYVIAFPEGLFMSNGITWSSDTGSCLTAGIKALRK